MKPPPQPVAEIAKQAAEEICEKMDGFSIHCSGVPEMESELTALILAAAAKMVRESKCLECGDAMAAYLAPGPVPTSEPTERDYLLADWDQAAAALRSITGEAGDRQG